MAASVSRRSRSTSSSSKPGPEQHLGEEVERRGELIAGAVEGEAEAAAPGEAVDVGGEALDATREVEGRPDLGAAQPKRGEEARNAGGLVVLGEEAPETRSAQRHHRDVVPPHDVQAYAAREVMAHQAGSEVREPRGEGEDAIGGLEASRDGAFDAAPVEGCRHRLREHRTHGEGLRGEVLTGHPEQVLGRRPADRVEVLHLAEGVSGEVREGADLARDAGDALPLEVLARQEVDPRPLQLVPGHGPAAHALDLTNHRFESGLGLLAGRLEARGEEPGIEGSVRRGVDAIGEACVLLHLLHQPARFTASKDVAEKVEERCIGVGESRNGPDELDARPLEGPSQQRVAKAPLRRFRRPLSPGCRRRGVGEGGAHRIEGVVRSEVAHQDDGQIVDAVPAAEEVDHPAALERRDALGRSEDR